MGSIMQTWTAGSDWQQSFTGNGVPFYRQEISGEEKVTYREAIDDGLIEVEQVGSYNGVPQVRIMNHSSCKILLFSGSEIIGKRQNRLLSISITLQHNASVVVPAFLLASTYFFDQGMLSIQQYLQSFKGNDTLSGVVYTINGKISGQRYGDFPLMVEVAYNH